MLEGLARDTGTQHRLRRPDAGLQRRGDSLSLERPHKTSSVSDHHPTIAEGSPRQRDGKSTLEATQVVLVQLAGLLEVGEHPADLGRLEEVLHDCRINARAGDVDGQVIAFRSDCPEFDAYLFQQEGVDSRTAGRPG